MDEEFFWRLVEDSRADIGADTERVAQALLHRLRTLRPSAVERQVVRGVLDDPDSLVTLAPDQHNARIDWFCGLPLEAYIAATGAPFAVDGPPGRDQPGGTPTYLTNEAEVRRHFPRLAAYLDDNRWIPRPWERSSR